MYRQVFLFFFFQTNECMYCQYGFNELKEVLQNEEVQVREMMKLLSDVRGIISSTVLQANLEVLSYT